MNQSSASRDSEKTPPRPCSRCGKPLAKDLKFTISSWFMTDPTEGLNRWQECCKCDFRSDLDELEALTASVGAALGDDYWPDDNDLDDDSLDPISRHQDYRDHDPGQNLPQAFTGPGASDIHSSKPSLSKAASSPGHELMPAKAKGALLKPDVKQRAGSEKQQLKTRANAETISLGRVGDLKQGEQFSAKSPSSKSSSKASPKIRSKSKSKSRLRRAPQKRDMPAQLLSETSIDADQSSERLELVEHELNETARVEEHPIVTQAVICCADPISADTNGADPEEASERADSVTDGQVDAALHQLTEVSDGQKHEDQTANESGTADGGAPPDCADQYAITIMPPETVRPQTYVIADRYSVQSVIGRGTLGTTYRVIDPATNRVLCLKLISSPICRHRRVVKRIMQEVEKAQTLNHPHIVPIYDSGMDKTSRLYYVMDYLELGSLKKLIRDEGFLDVPETLQIFLDVCDGLKYAHQQGILHRDLKPGNILLVREKTRMTAKLADFGIAKAIPSAGSEALAMTQSTDVFADPSYMSPEQCLGRKIDIRSEIYSIGCSMYEALVGKRVFRGPNALSIVVQHFKAQPKSFEEVMYNCDIPTDVEAVVCRMLEKAPENRYQSIEQLEEDLLLLKHNKRPSYAFSKKKNLRPLVFMPPEIEPIEPSPRRLGLVEDERPRLKRPRAPHAGLDAGRHAGNEWRSPLRQAGGSDPEDDIADKKARDYQSRQELLRERERKVREEIRKEREERILEEMKCERGASGEETDFEEVDVKAVSREIKRLAFPNLPRGVNPPLLPKITHQDGPAVLPFVEESKKLPSIVDHRALAPQVLNDQVILPGRIRLTEVTPERPAEDQACFGQILKPGTANWGRGKVFDVVALHAAHDSQAATQNAPLIACEEIDEEALLTVTTAEEAKRVVPAYLLPSAGLWPIKSLVVIGSLIASLCVLIFAVNFAGHFEPMLGIMTNLVILLAAVLVLVVTRPRKTDR